MSAGGQHSTGTCANCDAAVFYVQTGKYTFKWLTDPLKPRQWKCSKNDDPDNPGHEPTERFFAAAIIQTPPPPAAVF